VPSESDTLLADYMRLATRYAYAVDLKKTDLLEAVFTPDAVWDGTETGGRRHEGRGAVIEAFADGVSRKEMSFHLLSNEMIWEASSEEAKGSVYSHFIGIHKESSPYLANRGKARGVHRVGYVRYEDTLRRVDGEWRIHERIARKVHDYWHEGP
jgi:SnoaL-like protein